jgi:PPM family protein phosphatase
VRVVAAKASQRGRRPVNEDAAFIELEHGVFAVSDGMGGLDAGDVASGFALSSLEEGAAKLGWRAASMAVNATPSDKLALADLLSGLAQRANDAILEEAASRHGRMGATLTSMVVAGQTAFISHVGDTRAYRVRGGVVEQLTEDTSVAAIRLRLGRMTPEEYETSPLRSVLHEALGLVTIVEPEFITPTLGPGDVVVLCTDGVWGHLDTETLARLASDPDPAAAANALVSTAYDQGSDDNLTAVVVRCVEGEQRSTVEDALASIPLFQHFSPRERSRLAPFLEVAPHDPGATLCGEGDPGDSIYILLEGECEVSRRGRRLTTLKAPLQFGEIALVRGTPRTATVRALTHVRLLILHRDPINSLLQRQPRLGAGLMMQLCRTLADRVVDLTEQLAAPRLPAKD